LQELKDVYLMLLPKTLLEEPFSWSWEW
jgi:hypothetical protein